MKSYDVLGCAVEGAVYCTDCCPEPEDCEDEHGAVFADSEWDCYAPVCDKCNQEIEGVSVSHPGAPGEPCRWCGEWVE